MPVRVPTCVMTVTLCALLPVLAAAQDYGWTPVPPVAQTLGAVWEASTVMVRLSDGRVLAAGGGDGSAFVTHRGAAIFDGIRSWTPTGSLNHGRADATAVLLADRRAMVIGGSGTVANPDPCYFYFINSDFFNNCIVQHAHAETFDPATGTWSMTAPMSVPRVQARAVVLRDGRVLVTGGWHSVLVPGPIGTSQAYVGTTQLQTSEIYDPRTNTWTPAAPTALVHTAGSPDAPFALHLLADGRVVAWDFPRWTGSQYAPGAEVYDPASNTWSSLAGAPVRMGDAIAVLSDGRLLVSGGYTNSPYEYPAAGRIFDPVAGTWTDAPPMPTPRENDRAVTLLDGRTLFIGGTEVSYVFSEEYQAWYWHQHWTGSSVIFDPATNTWSAGPNAPESGLSALPLVPTSGRGLFNPAGSVYRVLTPPLAAGLDHAVNGTAGVIGLYLMSASASSDPDGDAIVDFTWRAGDTVLASGPSATASVPLTVGSHALTLTVTDFTGQTGTSTVTIAVHDSAAAAWGDLQICSAGLTSATTSMAALQAEVARLQALVDQLSKDKKDKKDKHDNDGPDRDKGKDRDDDRHDRGKQNDNKKPNKK